MAFPAPGLEIHALHVQAGAFHLADVDLTVPAGRVLVVLGPSGAGKTVMLDSIAGFRRPIAGRIALGGSEITHRPPEERRIGVVFQSYALFPHLSVAENVRFGPRASGKDDPAAVRGVLERVGIAHLADRKPGTLSGGERQRVAVARALAIGPRLLLLDEPLSALDTPTRDELRSGLRELLHGLGIPAVYVTHDQSEATLIGDDVAVLMGGRIRQMGTSADVLDRPVELAVARFLGLRTLGPLRLEAGNAVVGPPGRTLRVLRPPPIDGDTVACYRPSDVVLSPPSEGRAENTFDGDVVAVHAQGDVTRVEIAAPLAITAITLPRVARQLSLAPGTRIAVTLPPDALRIVRSA
ncbi:MAG: ABC transporter ATP-binding protein [Chloroflexota bacterium]|nr:ABC transporter ATP-binding protein [Chloroflexota bacterium]MDE3101015.1 ABC transporter ATP-binding protein [Chloroflexota bacterium]